MENKICLFVFLFLSERRKWLKIWQDWKQEAICKQGNQTVPHQNKREGNPAAKQV